MPWVTREIPREMSDSHRGSLQSRLKEGYRKTGDGEVTRESMLSKGLVL